MNTTLLTTYMEIGRLIVTDLKKHSNDETYETQSITTQFRELSKNFGKGFSRANIWNMIHFYQDYGSVQSLTERLT